MTSNLATLLPFTVIQSMEWTSGKLWKIASPVTQLPLCNDDTEKCCPSLPISGGSSVRRILGVFPNFPDGKKINSRVILTLKQWRVAASAGENIQTRKPGRDIKHRR